MTEENCQNVSGEQPYFLYEQNSGVCPYLPDAAELKRFWHIEYIVSRGAFSAVAYEDMLARGWRRSGRMFYRNVCPGCSACVPLRVRAADIAPSKSQRRVISRNKDISVTVSPASYDDEDLLLYQRYHTVRHGGTVPDCGDYIRFLVDSPVENIIIRYRTSSGVLAAVGWLDVLPQGLSSVYFAFDPAESRRSLGTFSVFAESDIAARMNKPSYYLGFWIAGSPKMAYKSRFVPCETARAGQWLPLPG